MIEDLQRNPTWQERDEQGVLQTKFYRNAQIVAKFFKGIQVIEDFKPDSEFEPLDFSQKFKQKLSMVNHRVQFGDE